MEMLLIISNALVNVYK